jgi:uncharacterized protein YndB with AHSA1/START domain
MARSAAREKGRRPMDTVNGEDHRPAHDWIKDLERFWGRRLRRIKGRAETIARASHLTGAGRGRPPHAGFITQHLRMETPMPTALENDTVQTLEIRKDTFIAASPEITFEALLEELGPGGQMPDGKPMPMKIEPWPGGRWYRELGEAGGHAYGHLWAHVQVIKAPALLELTGPMPMSYPATNHIQYRLKAEGQGTRLSLVHRAMGLIPREHMDGMPEGWEHALNRVKEAAERTASRR